MDLKTFGKMRTIGILALVTAFGLQSSDALARIYKTVDEDGNVVFTDVAPKDSSKSIEIDAHNVYTPSTPAVAPTNARNERGQRPEEPDNEDENAESAAGYDTLHILTPADDEPVRENAGNLSVLVAASPGLDSRHSVVILLDGVVSANQPTTRIDLANIDRGTHVLTAQIVDAAGNVLIASNPTSFHMLRVSVQHKPARRPAP
jgi:hypothetical protein